MAESRTTQVTASVSPNGGIKDLTDPRTTQIAGSASPNGGIKDPTDPRSTQVAGSASPNGGIKDSTDPTTTRIAGSTAPNGAPNGGIIDSTDLPTTRIAGSAEPNGGIKDPTDPGTTRVAGSVSPNGGIMEPTGPSTTRVTGSAEPNGGIKDATDPRTSLAGRADSPSLIPDGAAQRDNRLAGEVAPRSLAPEVSPGSALDDPFGASPETGGATNKGPVGTSQLELPDAPAAAELGRLTDQPIDVGLDFNNLAGGGSLDGRGLDVFDGVARDGGATGPADPGGVTSDGAAGLTTETQPASVVDWIVSVVATTAAEEAEAKVDKHIAGKVQGLTTPGVSYSDSEGVSAKVSTPEGRLVDAIGSEIPKFFQGQKNIDGSLTEREKQMQQVGDDGLPPDHPDYVAPPGAVPPGSAPAEGIQQSILQGLGGQRGGDVDPYDDPNGSTSGEVLFDPKNSVIDPGPDGFQSVFEADRSMIEGPMDAVEPELDGE
jgi:hypothetical protein